MLNNYDLSLMVLYSSQCFSDGMRQYAQCKGILRKYLVKNIFCFFFTELKTYHPSCSIYKHDAFDTADPSIMQDACYITDLAHYRVSVAQW